MPDVPPPAPEADPRAWETVLDPAEQAFTIAMPRGWQNRAWLRRDGPTFHQLVTSTSPSGETALFLGDPTIPTFCDPYAPGGPGLVRSPYVSIEHFLPNYVQRRFGGLSGFRILGMAPFPQLFQVVVGKLQRAGATEGWVTAGRLAFEFDEGPRRVRAVVTGSSTNLPPIWMVDVQGVCAAGDPEPFVPMLVAMYASRAATPATHQRQMQERAQSAAAHHATMQQLDHNAAILRAGHAQNMATLQGMASSHQAHMASLHEARDARDAAWSASQETRDADHAAAMRVPDEGHRRFLNTIAEERTVADAEGNTYQVADGYDRYFRRRSDGTWVGTQGGRDLGGLPGVNPDDFEEFRVKI